MQAIIEQQIIDAGLKPGDKLLVAVSGGVDSVVLLQLLVDYSARFDLSLHVAHLDHQLRPESAADAEFVRQLCARLALPYAHESKDVAALAEAEKLSLEMAGRQARREFLRRTAETVGSRLVALAHHRDDQVETFLLRLLRGSGVAGLAAMRSLDGLWWRPLLDCSREQILNYAQQQRLDWAEDASNSDPVFLRNRIRHQLLGQLRDINPRVDERIHSLCRQLQVDDRYWQGLVAELLPDLLLSSTDGLRLDRRQLVELPEALLIRVLREALRLVRGDLQRLESVHLYALVDLLCGERSQAQLDLPGCWAARRYDTLWLRQAAPVSVGYELKLPVPGAVRLPGGQQLRTELVAKAGGETGHCAEFDLAQVPLPLMVRSWHEGDSFSPAGMAGTKKLKRLFGDEKIELEERNKVPLLISGEDILWVAGLRRSRLAPVTEKATEILRVELIEEA